MATADYVCSLEEKYIKKAKDELNEIPSDRLAAVQALRDWVNQQQHLKFDTRTLNLIRILRHSKYSQVKARQTIENAAKFMVKNSQYICNLDPQCQIIQEVIRKGQIMLLPGYDEEGRSIVLYKLNMIPFETLKKKYSFGSFIRSLNTVFMSLMNDEMFHVNGVLMVFDMTGINLKMMAMFNDPESVRYNKESQDAQVGRMKGLHYYNVGSLFETMFAMYKPFMKKKLKERMFVHETLESLYKHIPKRMLPNEYLPDEYDGPKCGSLLEIAAQTADRILEMRDYILDFTNSNHIAYDESKKPAAEPLQHFRKLNID